jgi:hypothetical protein
METRAPSTRERLATPKPIPEDPPIITTEEFVIGAMIMVVRWYLFITMAWEGERKEAMRA